MKYASRDVLLEKIDFLDDIAFDPPNFSNEDVLVVLRKWNGGPYQICMCTVKVMRIDADRIGTWNSTLNEWYYFNPSLYKNYNIVIKILEKK